MFFSYLSNHIVSSFSSTNEIAATYHKLVWFEENVSFSRYLLCERIFQKVLCLFFIYLLFIHLLCENTFFHRCSLLSEDTCFLSFYAVQSLAERSSLYISLWNICIKKWQGLIYTAEQVADMISNDDIGEIESTDSLNKKSSSFSSDDEPSCQFEACSSNDELSFQSEVDNSSNSDSEFMVDESLLKNVLLEIVLWSVKKREEGSQTIVELSKQEVSFQTMGELSELEEAFQTMGEEPWGQGEGSRIVWQEIILILPTRKWTRQ